MGDVFEVLKKDHDEVKAMITELEERLKTRLGATDTQLTQRKDAVDRMIMEEARHEAAEQQYFWPALRQLGPEGARVAEEGLKEEAEADKVLASLDSLEARDAEFEKQLLAFAVAARAHIDFEETHAWPMLRASITAEEAQQLGEKITEAKNLAPTRPHPHIPPQAGPAKTVGPVAGAVDRLRDALSGRGGAA